MERPLATSQQAEFWLAACPLIILEVLTLLKDGSDPGLALSAGYD